MVANKRTSVSLEFEISDLPMLMGALSIARNAALMSGNKNARVRLEQYRKAVEALIPPQARLFDGEEWAEIGMALAHGRSWSVASIPVERWSHDIRVVVKVGDEAWHSKYDRKLKKEDGHVEAVRELLREIAPVDSVCLDDTKPAHEASDSFRF